MNPIAHFELSWLVAQGLPHRRDRVAVTLAGLAPDLDGLAILGGPERFASLHHLLTHGLGAAAVTAVVAAVAGRSRWRCAALAFVAFHLHLLCDVVGSGPGWPVAYLWPFSDAFWGWSGAWELASWPNGAIALVATLLCLATALPLGRTAVEVFSLRADRAVVAALRRRLLGSGALEATSASIDGP